MKRFERFPLSKIRWYAWLDRHDDGEFVGQVGRALFCPIAKACRETLKGIRFASIGPDTASVRFDGDQEFEGLLPDWASHVVAVIDSLPGSNATAGQLRAALKHTRKEVTR